MKRLLFVSIAFPPKNDPECLQTARYFKYLSEENEFEIDVVTSRMPTLFMPHDPSLEKYNQGYQQRIELPIRESRLTNFTLRALGMGETLFPDSKATFHKQWQEVARQLKFKPDVIYSRSNPMSSAFMARNLKANYKCPWVMHLSDPWALSPLKKLEKNHPWHAEEERLLKEADGITVTSERTRQLYANRYPGFGAKIKVIPNVYDPADLRENPPMQSDKLRIVYTGGLSGERDVFFLSTVLNSMDRSLWEKIEFVFAGDADRRNRAFFRRAPSCIRHMGLAHYDEAKKLCESAHLLLTVDNPAPGDQAVYFPSKLLDYFLAKKMIWAVTPDGSTTREILQRYPSRCFSRDQIQEMTAFLVESVRLREEKGNAPFQVSQVPSGYDARENAKILKEIILSV